MKNRLLSAAAVTAITLGAAHATQAQSIDYGSLQQLFNEPVTTSATGSPLRATEVPVDMTIITAEDIKRSGATDLPTILSRVPGIDILNWAAGTADVGVRGYDQIDSPRLLVLINGREVYLDDYGYTAWSTLPVQLSEIRQIEVVRGPNSALFGFNAVGGVINIITFNPKYDNTNSVEAHGGTQGDAGGSVVKTLHLGDLISLRVSGGGERQNEWKNSASDPATWNAHGMFDGVAQLGAKTELRVQGSLSRAAQEDMLPTDAYAYGAYTTKSLMGTVTSDTAYGQIQAQSYVNGLEFTTNSAGGLDIKNQVEVASLQDLFKIGTRSTIRIAVEYRNNLINTSPINTGHIGYSVWAPSAMWNFAATSKLSITAAARVDALDLHRSGTVAAGFPGVVSDWNRSTTAFSANLGAVYKLTDVDTVRATYARGIQVPTLVEYGGVQSAIGPAPYGLDIAGNPRLRPAVVSNYELSYDRALPALNALISAKGFYQTTDDVQGQWDFTSPNIAPTLTTSATTLYENAANSKMAGFELSASGKLKAGFHWSADTTYTNVTDKAVDGYDLIARQIDFAKSSPKFRGNVALGWTDGHWSADAFVHYVTQYDTYNGVGLSTSPAYASLSGRVAYQLPMGLVAALSGQNLTMDRQVQAGTLDLRAPRRVLVSLSKSW